LTHYREFTIGVSAWIKLSVFATGARQRNHPRLGNRRSYPAGGPRRSTRGRGMWGVHGRRRGAACKW